nr:pleiotropic drug resistance protein 3-like isoform X1 [Tanacetum cinerariifolium]
MAQLVGSEEIESLRIELSEIGRSLRSSFRRHTSSFRANSDITFANNNNEETDENLLQLLAPERHMFIEKLIKHIENDNLRLLQKLKKRTDRVGVQLPSVETSGKVSYNGYKIQEFVPQKTSAYISQNDLHIPEMTVRETLDFSSRCQGTGSRAEIMMEVNKREKEGGIIPDPDIDTFMKVLYVHNVISYDI